jgi:hypothetical protein
MVTAGVIGGFVALDSAIIGQIAYALMNHSPHRDETDRT